MIDEVKERKRSKAFTLIELIVVIAIIGIIVLLAAPKFLGHTKDAKLTQIKNDVKAHEAAVEVELVNADKLKEWNWESVEIDKMQEYVDEDSLFDRKGMTNEIDSNEFYLVNRNDVSVKSKLKGSFIYSKGGKVFYQDDDVSGENDSDSNGSGEDIEGEIKIPEGFTLLNDDDFEFVGDSDAPNSYTVDGVTSKGYFHYEGEADKVVIPHEIMGNQVKDYYRMFYFNFDGDNGTPVTAVVNDNDKVTDMSWMFMSSQATELDLSLLDTVNVTTMNRMFYNSRAGKHGVLDLRSFNTNNVTDMAGMFGFSETKELDLSSFDTSKETDMTNMFTFAKATTGWAKTKEDAKRFNNSYEKKDNLTFEVK